MKVLDRYKTKFTENQGPIGKKTIDKGERIFKELMSDSTENLLLHGDLHNDNILSSQRGWLAIDPKGVIGVREFEIGVYLRNPFYDLPKNSDHRKVETRRISQFAEELNLDKKRIKNWTMVCAVLSLLWSWEDSGSINSLYQQSFELLDEIKV
jgi:streptomycin 6-kinase